jgi:hypothetical protein
VVVAVEIEAVPEPAPEVAAEPAPVAPEPEPVAAARVELAPEPVGAVEAEPAPVVPEPEPEPVVAAKATPATEPVAAVESEPVPVVPEPEPEPVAAVEAVPEPPPTAVAAEPEPAPGAVAGARAADPVAGTAGIVAVTGALFAVLGLGLDYRYGEYNLAEYRPGMPVYVVAVAACALLGGILTLAPRTRRQAGPALLAGAGFAALFGMLRFLGEAITLADGSGTELGAGYAFELLAHIAVVVAGAFALAALRRNTAARLGFGKVRGWEGWVAIALGVVVAAGWVTQLGELSEHDTSETGRAAAYYVLGALLVLTLPVFAASLRPRAVGAAVLATGTLGLAGVLAPTFAGLLDHSSLTLAGQSIAVAGLALLVIDTVVWIVRLRRNQPIER